MSAPATHVLTAVDVGRETQPITHVPDWGWLDTGLAVAARSEGLTFIAFPAPVVAASAIIDEFRDAPLVSWASGDLTFVGVDIAREVRGRGARRWAEVIAGAHTIATNVPDVGAIDEPRDTMPTLLGDRDAHRAVIAGVVAPTSALGVARPRFVGGAAFAPGTADRPPWQGFGDAWFALPRWTYVHDAARAFLVLAVDATAARDHTRWRDELAIHRAAFATAFLGRAQPPLVELHPADATHWRTQVSEITDAIAHGTCTKIVASRTCSVALAGRVRLAELLATLDDRHADCVRVMVKPPHAGALVAATPERLVQREGMVVRCDALAGSIARPGLARSRAGEDGARNEIDGDGDLETATRALLASAKDRREHAIVVDAVRAVLEGAGARVDAPAEPVVRALRHVLHLYTPFRAELRAPRHVLELAARLHPTPAVGGTPSDVAAAWIETHEPAARGWYAAPVGWFDLDGNGELAVALRSGVIEHDRAHLWAGAGIVAGSDPDRELAETESKLRAMLGALGVSG